MEDPRLTKLADVLVNYSVAVRPGDLSGARRAVKRLASDPQLRDALGAGGRRAAETTYNRNQIGKKLDQFLRSLLPQ